MIRKEDFKDIDLDTNNNFDQTSPIIRKKKKAHRRTTIVRPNQLGPLIEIDLPNLDVK